MRTLVFHVVQLFTSTCYQRKLIQTKRQKQSCAFRFILFLEILLTSFLFQKAKKTQKLVEHSSSEMLITQN